MPSWFSKVFKKTEDAVPAPGAVSASTLEPVWRNDEEPAKPELPARRVVNAPVLVDSSAQDGYSEEIRIKARLNRGGASCTFLVDRPVLKGLSFVCPDRDTAHRCAPLAAELFDLGGVASVVIHDMTVTVSGDPRSEEEWEKFAREAGTRIRQHLKSGLAVVSEEVLARIPGEEEIRGVLQRTIDDEVNPGIAAHSGEITLNRVEGNTAYITMGGGCQGCAMSNVTLRQGIEKAFRDAAPYLGAILDETDHNAGKNPFFKEMPAEFR